MDFSSTVRECTRRLLATATEPLTVAHIADQVNTTPAQAGRALRQLEAEGAAVRQGGLSQRGGRAAALWTAHRRPRTDDRRGQAQPTDNW